MQSLEEKISQWRNKLVASQGLQEEVVDELADHLRQKLDELSGSDLCDEDKFILAKTRLGNPSILGSEFEKLNGRSVRLKQIGYMIGGYLLIDTLLKLVHVASQVTSGITISIENAFVSASTVYVITATFLLLALFYILWKTLQTDSALQNTTLFEKFSAMQRHYPRYTFGAILSSLILLTFANKIGFSIIMTRLISVQEFGNLMFSTAIYDISTELLIPLSLSAFLLWLIRTDREGKNSTLYPN